MGRPDFGQMNRQQRRVASFVGETATWRQYVSASAAAPAYGYGVTEYYIERRVTGLFRLATLQEVQAQGGQYVAGDVVASLIDCKPTTADEVLWQDTTYRAETEFIPQRIVAGSAYWGILRRGGHAELQQAEQPAALKNFGSGFATGEFT